MKPRSSSPRRILARIAAARRVARAALFVLVIALGFPLRAAADSGAAAGAGGDGGGRFALVIGNSSYQDLPDLRNPGNDAADMAKALRGLGFQTDLLLDADLVRMEAGLGALMARLSGSQDAIGIFFYAGHGVQSAGSNFLVPSDARIPSEQYLKVRALALQSVLDSLQSAGNALNVVILDACRDNPFAWARSGTRGLSVVAAQPPGSIIAYATSGGSVALDGEGRNGVFTGELLRHLAEPGIDVGEMFRRTGAGVKAATGGRQVPAVYSQYFDMTYLAGGMARAQQATVPAPAVPPSRQASSAAAPLPPGYEDAPPRALAAIARAESLKAGEKWVSAWNELARADPRGADPWLLAARAAVALEGSVEDREMRFFGLYDLEPGENRWQVLESGARSPTFVDLGIVEAYDAMRDPPAALERALGDFWSEARMRHADGWPGDGTDPLQRMILHYGRAYGAGILDSYRVLAWARGLTEAGRADEAAAALRPAFDAEAKQGYSYLALLLADALADTGNFAEAMRLIDGVVAMAADGFDRRFGLRRALETAQRAGSAADVERCAARLEDEFPGDAEAAMLRMRQAFARGDGAGAAQLADEAADANIDDPFVAEQLLWLWVYERDDRPGALAFLDRAIERHSGGGNPYYRAWLLLYRAKYRHEGLETESPGGDPGYARQVALILADLDLAEMEFLDMDSDDDYVYEAINGIRAALGLIG